VGNVTLRSLPVGSDGRAYFLRMEYMKMMNGCQENSGQEPRETD